MKALILATAALLAGPASASVITLGSNARACYSAAEARTATLASLDNCNSALAVEPLSQRDKVATLVNRGILFTIREEFPGAAADFEEALRLDPNQPEAWLNKGVLALAQGDARTASQLAQRAIELNTRKPGVAFYIRALGKEDAGDYKAAYADLLRAAALEPSWSVPRRELKRYRLVSR
jgi:tetratricopeptide (TPR) repeat protein